ncbi:MAG: hypothetical protein NTW30_00675 [Candidatus Aenigmarchaeota archaeon]|nr:hypothetical protein [Candidatus Aenigmarchaeota archaeon]
MRSKNRIICDLIIFLSFFIINNIVKAGDFDAWVGAPSLFTIGKTELVNIYVKNTGSMADSYNITNYTKYAKMQGHDVPHLVSVSIQSHRIKTLEWNETGDTFAKITILGPISDGKVTFNISNADQTVYRGLTIDLTAGFPIVLSEFDFSGLIQILLITLFILVVSYASHVS